MVRRKCTEEVRATYCTSVRDMLPMRFLEASMTAIEEIPWDVIFSRAVITLASEFMEITLDEPIYNSPIYISK